MQFAHQPDYAFHPGETLAEALDELGMTVSNLARKSGLSRDWLEGLIGGSNAVNLTAASLLEKAIGIPAGFWMRSQANFDHHSARVAVKP